MAERLAFSVPHAAQLLDCSRDHIYDLIVAGRLATIQLGTGRRPKTRVTAASLERLMQAATRAPRTGAR